MTEHSDGPEPAQPPEREPASALAASEGVWRRQHPAALIFNAIRTLRALIFPIVAGVLVGHGLVLRVFLGIVLLFSIGSAFLRYWRYRYRFDENELVVEQGWLYRQVRHISYVRIQNINITRNVLHRLAGVSGVQLESASGMEPEAVMEAVSSAAIEELHERVERAKARQEAGNWRREEEAERPEAGEAEPEIVPQRAEGRRQILRLGVGELVRHGLISNRGMFLVAAAIGYLFQGPLGERTFPAVVEWIAHHTELRPADVLEALGPFSWFLAGLAVFAVAMVFLALLSVIYAIFRFYGFTLSGDSQSLRAEYGLFTRVAITIPRRRIQLIGFRANPFHRLWRRLSLKVETAGFTGGEETASSLRWLAPILPLEEAPRVLREVQPQVEWEGFEWRPLHPKTRVRLLRVRLILLAIVVALLAFATGLAALLALLLAPLVLAYARGYFRYAGWAVTPGAVAFRSGWIVKQQSVVRYPKIQVVTLRRNPFDRRWGMATVSIDTAGADPAGHSLRIRFMDYESACELREFLEEKIRETRFVW